MSEAESADAGGAETGSKVVFFVDDDDLLRSTTARGLELRGYEVVVAGSATEAAEVMEAHDGPIDVLLMDINLPDGWGATLAHQLRQVRPSMALVYTTGFAKVDPVLSGGLNAADFVVTKPFRIDGLVAELERAIAANG